jgi:hypothetical protein
VYGNYLDNLSQPLTIIDNQRELLYPMIVDRYVYFALQMMEHYADIPPAIVAQLNIRTHSKYHHPPPHTNDVNADGV